MVPMIRLMDQREWQLEWPDWFWIKVKKSATFDCMHMFEVMNDGTHRIIKAFCLWFCTVLLLPFPYCLPVVISFMVCSRPLDLLYYYRATLNNCLCSLVFSWVWFCFNLVSIVLCLTCFFFVCAFVLGRSFPSIAPLSPCLCAMHENKCGTVLASSRSNSLLECTHAELSWIFT